jgi:hypothetical protein
MKMCLRNLLLGLSSAAALVLAGSVSFAQSPSAAETCTAFNALSERHGESAREILAKAGEQAKSMPPADAEKYLAANKAGADSEWQMSALARDAYRKCMQDYLSGGSAAAPQAPAPAAPVKQQAVQQPAKQQSVKQQSVKQAPPKKKVTSAQKPRVQQVQQPEAPMEPEPQQTFQPLFPGLLGIGIGLGR